MVAVGILFVVSAWLAGPGRRALGARGWLAPALRNRVWAYLVLLALGLLLLFHSSVVDFTRALTVAILVALGVAWIEITRAQSLREYPDASAPELFADARERFSQWWASKQAAGGQAAAAPAAAFTTAGGADIASQLASLADLHARGALTDEEYASAKSRVLGSES
jgi:hypothetical protein